MAPGKEKALDTMSSFESFFDIGITLTIRPIEKEAKVSVFIALSFPQKLLVNDA